MSNRIQNTRWIPSLLLGLLVSLPGCVAAGPWNVPILNKPAQRILFIGNSYTFYNGGLDKLVTQIAQQRGKQIACIASTSGGKSLEWHWNEGNARQFIATTDPDWVVLQDYSLQPLDKRPLMFEYARKFDPIIKQAGAKTAFYMTWARQNQPQNQATITDAYRSVGKELDATVIPCGIAWQRVMRERPDIKLYRGDNSHPTAEGSYLNACMFYIALVRDDPRGLPPLRIFEETLPARTLSEGATRYLQGVAWETLATPQLVPH